MLITKNIEIKPNTKTFKYFKDLGYNFKLGDLITIPIHQLNLGSHAKVKVECDICHANKQIKYQDYLKNISLYNIYTCCAKCSLLKRQLTHLELYGVVNPSQLNAFKEKKKITTIKNHGVVNPSKSNLIKIKKEKTTLKNYGVDNPLKSKEISLKVKNTNIERYGGVTPFFSKSVQNKSLETNFKKFGHENAMQNQKIFSKNKKSNFKTKEYTLPSGKIVNIQGFENLALDLILKRYSEKDIIINDNEIEKTIGELWYFDIENKKHRYFPDIFIISEKKIIEVKSTWTYNIHKSINLLKQKSCLDAGFKFEFMIFNKKKQLLT